MFSVGQKVVCVDDRPDAGRQWRCEPLRKNVVYTIRDHVAPMYGSLPCVRLCEIVRGLYDEHGFRACRFRPLIERKTDISIFTAMLNPDKSKTSERVE